MRELYVEVLGTPVPQGSMRALTTKSGQPYMIHSNAALKPWRDAVVGAIRDDNEEGFSYEGAVEAFFVFVLPRPQSARRSRPHVRPDLDKLARSVLDACTDSGVIRDDGQVCKLTAVKYYCHEAEKPSLKLYLKELTD